MRADLYRLIVRQPADAAHQRSEIFAIHKFQGNEVQAVRFADVVNAAEVRMRQLARDADLVVKACHRARTRSGGFGQELERNLLVQLQVGRAIDLAHAALPEERDDAIAAG